MSTDVDNFLAHYGIKGMQWGVRKRYSALQDRVHSASPGSLKTQVIAKTGERISVVKEKPGPLALGFMKLRGGKPEEMVSTMLIEDSTGKKVGSFQVWREGPDSVRGEWLQIDKGSQGRGYSKAAIQGLIIAAEKDPKLKNVRLQVPSNADPAKHIYQSLGFSKEKDLGEVPGYGNLEDWVRKL